MRKSTSNSVNKITKNKHHGSLRGKVAKSLKQLFEIKILTIHVIYVYRQSKANTALAEPRTITHQ